MLPRLLWLRQAEWAGSCRSFLSTRFCSTSTAPTPPFEQLLDKAQHSQQQRHEAVRALVQLSDMVLAQRLATGAGASTAASTQATQALQELPPVQSLNELIRLCADTNDVDSVFKVLGVLEQHGVSTDEDTFVQLSSVFQYLPKDPPTGKAK